MAPSLSVNSGGCCGWRVRLVAAGVRTGAALGQPGERRMLFPNSSLSLQILHQFCTAALLMRPLGGYSPQKSDPWLLHAPPAKSLNTVEGLK